MAKDTRPGQRNNLDALCRHFGIDNAKRTLHGALLDAELLAEVYMAMTRGQDSLLMDLQQAHETTELHTPLTPLAKIQIVAANQDELAAHQAYVAGLQKSGAKAW